MAFLAAIPAAIGAAASSLGTAGTLGILGAGVSALGTIAGGMAQANEAKYQAEVAQNNAKIAAQNSVNATEAGQEQAEQTSLKGAAIAGQVQAAEAANGVDVNSGSNVDVKVSQRAESKLDTDTVMNNALLQSYGYRTQQSSYLAQAQADKAEASEAPIGAAIGAFGSFLGNAGSIGMKWAGMQDGGQ